MLKEEDLQKSLHFHFLTQKLGVAGQLVYLEKESNTMVLGIHTTGPEKAEQVAQLAWDSIPEKLKAILSQEKIGFAVRMI